MEDIVIAEFEKHKIFIENEFRKKYNLSEEDINTITDVLKRSLTDMIQLVKEGKSAHEKFFSDVIMHSIDAIVGYDNESRIFLWNEGAERIFGYSKNEIMHKDFSILIPDHLLKKGEKEFLINEIIQKGFIENYETERITKNDEIINISLSRFAVYNRQNEIIASVGIIRDITKIKALEKKLLEKERLALIGEVVSNIAHNLSNPLNIISGNADYLLLDKKSSDKEYEELRTILDETRRITKSIRHLLNFSRPLQLHKTAHDLNRVIDKAIENSKYITGNKKIKFEKNLQKSLPGYEFDESAFEDVINNLISNSIQAISSEGIIGVKSYKNGNSIKIEVSDTGQGIPKEDLPKIFLPFFSSKEYGKGTGLGLSLARRIILEYNGDIKVKSTVGKGTSFTITLPYPATKS